MLEAQVAGAVMTFEVEYLEFVSYDAGTLLVHVPQRRADMATSGIASDVIASDVHAHSGLWRSAGTHRHFV